MTQAIKAKTKAAASHLLINLFLFSVLVIILLKLWYPPPYFTASGGFEGLKIVALVDIVLGPILTLVIFNPEKKKSLLIMDITLILILQIGAFMWGTWAVYNQRPVATVFWEDRFYTVPAAALTDQKSPIEALKRFGEKFPVIAEVEKPLEPNALENLMTEVVTTETVPYQLLNRFRPHTTDLENLFRQTVDIAEILKNNIKMKSQLDEILSQHQLELADCRYLRLESKYHNTVMVMTPDGTVIGYLDAPYKTNN